MMLTLKRLVGSVAVAVIAAATPEPGAGQVACPTRGENVLRGVIVSAASMLPLQDAEVLVETLDCGVFSNVDGQFRISGLDAGLHHLVVSLLGYKEARLGPFQPAVAAPLITVALADSSFRAEPITCISTRWEVFRYRVVDAASGESLASVATGWISGSAVDSLPFTRDADVLSARVLPGSYSVTILAPDFSPWEAEDVSPIVADCRPTLISGVAELLRPN